MINVIRILVGLTDLCYYNLKIFIHYYGLMLFVLTTLQKKIILGEFFSNIKLNGLKTNKHGIV